MRKAVLVFTIAVLLPTFGWGWGREGHRIIAPVAKDHLNETTKVMIQSLIGNNHLYSIASWADDMCKQNRETGPSSEGSSRSGRRLRHHPTRNMRRFLEHVRDVGFSGVINYPTVSRFDGNIRRDLESVGLGFAREVEMIALARGTGLYTTCYVRTPDESRQMAEAGVDLIVPHVGLTAGGTIGASHTLSLDEAVKATQDMIDTACAVNSKVIALAHGGPGTQRCAGLCRGVQL
jgi:hypothetical protein